MAAYIPFIPGETNYELVVPIDGVNYVFNTRWNSSEKAHYFDFLTEDNEPILVGVKIVLGVNLGGRCRHPFFMNNLLRAIDTTGAGLEPKFDDLGRRVQVLLMSADEFKRG